MNKVCYLDLDGVLVDFVKGALQFHNRPDLKHEDIKWELEKIFGLTPEQFWQPLDYNFWANLEWTQEGKEILTLVESHFGDNVAILTSPPKTSGAVQGKLDWVAREIPAYKRKTFVGARKDLMAAPTKLLVDDHEPNVAAFRKASGEAFLIPRPWNGARQLEHNMLIMLERYLHAL